MSGSHPHGVRAGRIRLRGPAPRAVLAGCAVLVTVALAVAGPGGAWAAFTGTTAGTGNRLVTEATFPDYRAAVQRSGPVVHHPFDDPYGSSTAAALAGAPGTYNGAAAATSIPTGAIVASSGDPRRAVHFPERAYATADSTTSITGSGTAGAGELPRLTLEAWVHTGYGYGGAVVSLLPDPSTPTAGATQLYINTSGEACVGLTLSSGTQEVCGSDSTDLKVWSSSTDTPVWRHIAAVVDPTAAPGSGLCRNDGAQVSVYLDGVVQYDSALCAGWPESVTGRVRVGTAPIATDGGTPARDTWSGGIDEVAVYAAALNATEIKKHYDLGKGTVAGNYATSVTSFASLRMYWQLEEQPAAGVLTVADASGQNRGTFHGHPDLQVAGAPTGTAPAGVAVRLRGVNDISGGASRPLPTAFSTEVWFSSSGGTGPLVSFGSTQTGSATLPDIAVYLTATGRLAFTVRSPQRTVVTTTDHRDGGWHLVTATMRSDGRMSLYLDGVQVGENASSASPGLPSGFWRWGGGGDYSAFATRPGADFFSGRLDEASVYDRELTPEEVAVHWGASF
ncbi:LamG domain-containing protein [Geodermatophilus poikilotrophus]|uniref:Concanavalin A-like lectin/glucanases superfamily protein n=1 Tax=Geodermatophilus poikilotrophus TaxID=1333667 RepID=A0A1I0EXH4_9ACTN|nr:LamG-like jellyroll fold domain-containing protein [Geodermatophilus poikilotrophus]SET50219.1 Concanavalin A-like lectin/glucanases superfamily protein [Geodermatophilus poikilotrophus]